MTRAELRTIARLIACSKRPPTGDPAKDAARDSKAAAEMYQHAVLLATEVLPYLEDPEPAGAGYYLGQPDPYAVPPPRPTTAAELMAELRRTSP